MSVGLDGGGSSFIHHGGGGGMSFIPILGNGCGGGKDQKSVLKRGEEEVGGGGGGSDSGGGCADSGDSSSSSSSIGRNSDLSNGGGGGGGGGSDDAEVQSSYKGGPFDSMDSLEDVLPIRKGISKFYCGKSKSFTSLRDATCSSSIKEIAKPENVYSKKRKNLLACSILLDKNNNNFPLRSNGGGGISKRPITSSRSTLALAVAMNKTNSSESNSGSENSSSPPPLPRYRPPLHPNARPTFNSHDIESPLNSSPSSPQKGFSTSWRSFSLADLQYAAAGNSATTSNSSISTVDKQKKFH